MKNKLNLILIILFFSFGACEKPPTDTSGETQKQKEKISTWECFVDIHKSTITLTIDSATNLVDADVSPILFSGGYIQFVHGEQYLLQHDTLYVISGTEKGPKFLITKISKKQIEMECMHPLPSVPGYIHLYLFNKKK